VLVNAYFPEAKSVTVKRNATGREYEMELVDELGFYAVILPGKRILKYSFIVEDSEGNKGKVEDKYAIKSQFDEKDLKKFENGIHYDVYKKLGAHPATVGGVDGTYFAVWAPSAMRVSVVGTFNDWDGRTCQMGEIADSGIFEVFVPNAKRGDLYKFELKIKGNVIQKADPYGYMSELMPNDASVICDLSKFDWTDSKWMKARKEANYDESPVSIYELHLGSFDMAIEQVNYRTIAPKIAEYVQNMGYTHIELMPITEYKDEDLDGYKVTGYYAPTSTYGTPEDFIYFVDYMHSKNIGVIADWVVAHFAADDVGLANFDVSCLYEHLDPRQGIHPELGTHIFNYNRPQVSNFLLANAFYWLDEYHLDGLRVNDVASMLYLDYGRKDGEWIPNMYGENENLHAAEFFKHLNSIHSKRKDGTMIIAQETSSWRALTKDVEEEGLGFNYKWNTDWANDTMDYILCDPLFRQGKHGQITLSMLYNYTDKFILQLSHDVVARYNGSIMSSLTGEFTQNHATMKTLLAYMMMHPGKKLLFMGQDFAYTKKWSTNEPLDWRLRDKESYREVNDLVRDLNKLYSSKSALHVNDLNEDGFEWINEMDATRSIISFIRKSNNLEETLLVVCNFTPVEYEGYSVGVPYKGRYKEIFTTEDEKYGGLGSTNPRLKNARPGSIDGREFYINVTVAPMSVSVFDYTPLVSSKVNVKDEDSNVIDSNTSTNSTSKNAGGSKKTVASKSVNKSNTKRSTTSKNATKSSKNNSASKTVKQATDAISKKAKEVKDKVGKEVSSKADKVTKKVGSKANEIKKKANSAKDLVTETVTVTADDVKKAAKKVTKKTEKKVDRK
jgi:1,4-alpha-glucan branching enzyme